MCRHVLELACGTTPLCALAAVRTCARCTCVVCPGARLQHLVEALSANAHQIISERLRLLPLAALLHAQEPPEPPWDCLLACVSSASDRLGTQDVLQLAGVLLAGCKRVVLASEDTGLRGLCTSALPPGATILSHAVLGACQCVAIDLNPEV